MNDERKGSIADWLIPNATVFLSSACVMIVELVAGRIISRHLGQSLYTWTSVIGVVLAGISAGNYLGGRVADRFQPHRALSVLFLLSSAMCFAVPVLNNLVGQWTWLWERSWPTRIVTHVFLTFLLPSAMLGTISPVVAKMALSRGRATGRTIGDVYAWGAIGSIFGTFLAGFYLVAALGTTAIIAVVGVMLAVLGLLYAVGSWVSRAWTALSLVLVLLACGPGESLASLGRRMLLREPLDPNLIYSDESQYSHIRIRVNPQNPAEREMYLDKLKHSLVNVTNLVHLQYTYMWAYEAVLNKFSPTGQPVSVMVLGGGGYSFPTYVELTRPGSRIEVAEIDPAVTQAAMAAFGLSSNTTVRSYAMDARNYVADLDLRRRRGEDIPRFDYILGDSVNDYSVPYQLTTEEFTRMVHGLLADDGLYMLNLIDIFDQGRFLGAMVNTCKRIFPHVYVLLCGDSTKVRSTFMIVSSKQERDMGDIVARIREKHPFRGVLLNESQLADLAARTKGLVLTDEHAPIENLLAGVIRADTGGAADRHLELGVMAAREGRLDVAREELLSALRLEPNHAIALYNLGVLHMNLGEYGEALDAFGQVAQLDPTHVQARNNAAMILAQVGYIDQAIEQWRLVARMSPDSADVHNNLGTALAQKGLLDEAVVHWEEALRLKPDNALTYNNLGNVRQSKGELDAAAGNYRRALAIEPRLAEAHNNLGNVLAKQGRIEEAVAEFKSALAINPAMDTARRNLEKWSSAQ